VSVAIVVSFFRNDRIKLDNSAEIEVLKLDKVNYWSIDKLDPKHDTLDILESIAVEGSSDEALKGYSYKLVKAQIKGHEYEYGLWLSSVKDRMKVQIFDRPAKILRIGVVCGKNIFREPPIDYIVEQDSNTNIASTISSSSISGSGDGSDSRSSEGLEVQQSRDNGSLRTLYVSTSDVRWFDVSDGNIYVYEGEVKLDKNCHGLILVTEYGDKILLKDEIEATDRKVGTSKKVGKLEGRVRKKSGKVRKRSRAKTKGRGSRRKAVKTRAKKRSRSRRSR